MMHTLALLAVLQFGMGGVHANSGPIPNPPPTATTYSNLQNAAGNPGTWGYSTGTQACTPDCPSKYGGTGSTATGQSSPSLSGSSILLTASTSAANYAYNLLGYRNWYCYAPQSGTTTSGTLTINVTGTTIGTYVPGSSTNSISISANATDTTYRVTAIQIYVDGSSSTSYNSAGASPITPVVATLGSFSDSGSHVFAVKAFNSNGGSAIFTFTISFGPQCGASHHSIEHVSFYVPAANTGNIYAYENDPRLLNGGYTYEAAFQCRIQGIAPLDAWYVWSPAASSWVLPGGNTYPCTYVQGWNYLDNFNTIDSVNHNICYNAMNFNAVNVYRGQSFCYAAATGASFAGFGLQFQVDVIPNASGAVTVMEYVDRLTYSLFP
jgi:hypothetical protein